MDIIKEFEDSERPARQRPLKVSYFRTGCTLLDVLVGGGVGIGFPAGKIINFEGNTSSGKTFFACELIAAAYHQYKERFKWVYDDAEKGFSFDGRALWGVPVVPDDPAERVYSDTVEDLYYHIRRFLRGLKDSEVGIYVVDSLDALCNSDMAEEAEERMKAGDKGKAYDKGSYNLATQKFLSQTFFRTIGEELDKKNCLLVFVSQMRDNLNAGLYGERDKKSGGRALDFYCHTVVRFKRKESFVRMGRAVGSCVEAELRKSKTPRPYRKALVNLLFDYGIDDISTNVDYVYDLKSPKTGQLLGDPSAASLNIGDTSDPEFGRHGSDLAGVKEFLEANGYLDACRDELKAAGLKCTKDNYLQWIAGSAEAAERSRRCYGTPVSRDGLVAMADKDAELRRRLKRMAMDKWEAVEREIASNRVKYSDGDDY